YSSPAAAPSGRLRSLPARYRRRAAGQLAPLPGEVGLVVVAAGGSHLRQRAATLGPGGPFRPLGVVGPVQPPPGAPEIAQQPVRAGEPHDAGDLLGGQPVLPDE